MANANVLAAPSGGLKLERLPAVKARVGLGKSEIYRRIALGTFPRPLKLGGARASAFDSREIDQWIADRIAERDAKAVVA